MKTKLYAALFALVASAGLFAATHSADAYVAPSCKGSGQTCAFTPDGTVYVKGIDNIIESN